MSGKNHVKTTHFVSCSMLNGKFFLHDFLEGTLLNMDLATGQMKYLDAEINNLRFGSASGYHLVDESLYMVQKDLKYIMRYDIHADRAECFKLPCNFYTPTRPNACLTVMSDKDIYIFPVFDKIIYVFNVEEKRVVKTYNLDIETECMANPFNVAKEKDRIQPRKVIFCKGLRVGDKVWLIPGDGREMVCWFLKEGRQEVFLLPKRPDGYCDACWYDEKLYLLSSDGTLGVWSQERGYRDFWGAQGTTNAFIRVAVTDRNIWLLPCMDGEIKVYDRETGQCGPCSYYPKNFAYDRFMPGQSLFFLGCEDKDWYYFSMCAQTHMLWVNKHTGQPYWLKPLPPYRKDRIHILMRHNHIVREKDYLQDLNIWLKELSKYSLRDADVDYESVGDKIYGLLR